MIALVSGWLLMTALTGGRAGDTALYETYASWTMQGAVPYRDFVVEYPPLALPVFVVPDLVGGSYGFAFAAVMALFAGLTLLVTLQIGDHTRADPHRVAAAFVVGLLTLTVHPPRFFDLAPTLFATAGLAALLRDRPGRSGALLALGAGVKLVPLLLAPVFLAWLNRRSRRARPGRRALVGILLPLVVIGALLLLVSVDGATALARYHLDRPAQISSSPALLLRLGDALGLTTATSVGGFGSNNLVGAGGAFLIAVGALAIVATVVAASSLLFRALHVEQSAAHDARLLTLASFVCLAAFATFGKVLSPQFMTWLVPLLALLAGWGDWRRAGLLLIIFALTSVETAVLHPPAADGDLLAAAGMSVRNALLVVLIVSCLRALRSEPDARAATVR